MYYTYRLYSIVITDWDEWGAWSTCSKTCGSGILTRYRSCPPPPANRVSNCPGNEEQAISCFITTCPGIY